MTRPARLARPRRADLAATTLLGAALPAGFRDRQRGEWLNDLGELRPGARLRYLVGAAWTLPGLRRSVLRHGGGASDLGGVRLTRAATAARILLAGLIWPVLSWILFVPVRYYALDVPRRLAEGAGHFDPKDIWPIDGTPAWMMPVWVVLYLGAWVAMLGGPVLVSSVTLVGVVAVVRRHRGRLGRLVGVAGVTMALLLVPTVGLAIGMGIPGYATVGAHDGIPAIGVLGVLAILCALRVGDLTRRARTGLAVMGVASVAIALCFYTAPGAAMVVWYLD